MVDLNKLLLVSDKDLENCNFVAKYPIKKLNYHDFFVDTRQCIIRTNDTDDLVNSLKYL
jgi:hypothetical protein